MMEALILMTRIPHRGYTKTRLMPQISPEGCEAIHRSFLLDYFECFDQMQACRDIFIAYAPEHYTTSFLELIPEAYVCFEQVGKDIGERMLQAFKHVFDLGYSKVVLVGCDIPHIQLKTYEAAYLKLDEHDMVISPTYDGGYCLIGLKAMCETIFVNDFKWGKQSVVEKTYKIANQVGLEVSILEKYRDIDEYDDLLALWRDYRDTSKTYDHRPYHTLKYFEGTINGGRVEWIHTV